MTEDSAEAEPRQCLFPRGMQSAQLYHSADVLNADVQRCVALGWDVVDLDASGWAARDQLHADLASGLSFPSYYGHNLDALDDAMNGLAEGRYGFSATASGGAILLRHFDLLMAADPAAAAPLAEIMATAALRALSYGWPLAVLIQTDDPDLVLPIHRSAELEWNPVERRRSDRA